AAGSKERSLLIVEEDVGLSLKLIEASRRAGFKTFVLQRGELTLSVARKIKPAAIAIDITLTGLNGWRVLDLLKQDKSTRHLPVIMLAGADAQAQAARLGAS